MAVGELASKFREEKAPRITGREVRSVWRADPRGFFSSVNTKITYSALIFAGLFQLIRETVKRMFACRFSAENFRVNDVFPLPSVYRSEIIRKIKTHPPKSRAIKMLEIIRTHEGCLR